MSCPCLSSLDSHLSLSRDNLQVGREGLHGDTGHRPHCVLCGTWTKKKYGKVKEKLLSTPSGTRGKQPWLSVGQQLR